MLQVNLFELGPRFVDASGGLRSRGRTALLKALEHRTREDVAKAVRCCPEFVGYCAAGKRKPERWRLRVAFERQCGIVPRWWDERDDGPTESAEADCSPG